MFSINTKSKTAILLALWVAAFIPVYPSLLETWFSIANNSHGVLVPFLSAFFIWQKRNQLHKAQITSCKWGVVILTISMLFYIFSYVGSVTVISRAMIVFSLIGLILYNFGVKVFSIIAFPLFYLIFIVPVPTSIYSLTAFPLQLFATKVSTFFLKVFSIPVYREGNMLYFAQTQLEVAEACSGLRSMVSFIMLSFLFAYLLDKYWFKRTIIVLLAIPLALFVNIIRVTCTGILAHHYGDKVARGFLHDFSGMAVFVLGFILMLCVYSFLDKIIAKKTLS